VQTACAALTAAEARVLETDEVVRGTRLEVAVGAQLQLIPLVAEREAIAARLRWLRRLGAC